MIKMREAFDSWMDNDDWKFADREAAWKWMYEAGYQAAMTQDLNEYRDTIAQQAELLAAHKAEMQDWQRALLSAQQENAEYRAALEMITKMAGRYASQALAKHSPEDEIERARRMV